MSTPNDNDQSKADIVIQPEPEPELDTDESYPETEDTEWEVPAEDDQRDQPYPPDVEGPFDGLSSTEPSELTSVMPQIPEQRRADYSGEYSGPDDYPGLAWTLARKMPEGWTVARPEQSPDCALNCPCGEVMELDARACKCGQRNPFGLIGFSPVPGTVGDLFDSAT